jgi:hypothetical protein
MYARFITDPDVEELSFEDQRHFVFVLCLKCDGLLDKEFGDAEKRERAISRRLGLQGEAFTNAKERLVASGLIGADWQPRSWDSLQFKSDHDGAERQRRSRANRNVTTTSRDSHTPEQNRTDTDTEQREESRDDALDPFDEFWSAYPRRVGKAAAKRVWSRKGLNAMADKILEHLRARVRSDAQWLAEGGKFIPHPSTWLGRDGWDDEYEVGAVARGTNRQSSKSRFEQNDDELKRWAEERGVSGL